MVLKWLSSKLVFLYSIIDEDMFMDSDGVLANISIDRFLLQIGGSYEAAVMKNEKSYEVNIINIYLY